ncbi:MAG TPA: hypothetical protein VIL35_10285 [Vicinamibacterales bacterium]
MSRGSRLRAVAAATAALVMLGLAPAHAQQAQHAHGKKPRAPEPIVYTVDVAEDMSLFIPTFVKPEHTQPEPGSFFVTRGRVFPEGTIQGSGADFDPNRSGHIGVWICRGTHLVAASEIPDAPWWVSSAQLFVLGRQGKEMLTTEGIEGKGTIRRVVTGGAGNYAGWTGEAFQTFLGFNSTGGVNLRVTFVLRPPVQ